MFARVRYADGSEEPSRLPAAAAWWAATGITAGGSGPSGRAWTSTASCGSPRPLVRPSRPRPGARARRVTLVRRWRELLPPGPGRAGANGRSTPSTPTRLPARRRRRRRDEGGRDLGAVLVQGRRDVHPRALQDRPRARRGRLDDLSRPALYSFYGDDGILPGHPDGPPAPGASSSSTRAPPPSRSSTCFCWWARSVRVRLQDAPRGGRRLRLPGLVRPPGSVGAELRRPAGHRAVLLLMLAPSGSALSVDRWLGGGPGSGSSRVRSGRFG